jgi:hypothetical protein
VTRRLARLLLGVLAVPLCGCTIIGWAIGYGVDHGKPPREKPVARSEIDTLHAGQKVEVHLWDGQSLRGEYQGLEWDTFEAYAPRYEAARAALEGELALPALGPGARLVVTSGGSATGDFRGLGPGFIRFLEAGASELSIRNERIASLRDAAGHDVNGTALDKLLSERRVPTLTSVKLRTASGSRLVPHEDIAGVSRLDARKTGRTVGLFVGLTADIVVSAIAIHDLSDSGSSQPSNSCSSTGYCTSCPRCLSFAGKGFVREAEALGGSFLSAAERTDLVRLDHLVARDGRYRLRVVNEQDEIDHLDAVRLRVVDHAPGTEVVADAIGRVHIVRRLQPPLATHSVGSTPREGRSVPRDGLELEYARDRSAASALLIARVGATALGPRVLAEVLALQGRDLGRFYASLERSPGAREAFERAREREVLPAVSVFDGTTWRVAGRLHDLPTLVWRDEAVPLDLRGIPGDTLRLRIEGPPGMFRIDRAVVSFEDEPPLDETLLGLAEASDDSGRDVRYLLERADGRRHSLRPHLDGVTLSFAAPAPRPGRARSVLVEATGYYNVMLPADGEPQPDLFRRLLTEPGAVARFARERLSRPGA